ncbi:hypothetical protein [Sinomicrobium soli]|uniref:hypothetical protein n=1 Tax=Sinomicrobium sp. N-1-3-6 TaxID=2219864 RepID=UPI000DCD2BA7|nr:hypothetical protein [Sinomicrobium sp. N-1-3-6]RAV28708.1 hypothetical protein DN748_12200 [Sinomicrobium sp. N-1-3-6]
MKRLILPGFIVLFNLVMISCSSDDDNLTDKKGEEDPPKEEEFEDGGTVYTSQLVTIDKKGASAASYEGTFNDHAIALRSETDSTLVFMVLSDLAKVGEDNFLKVPDLDLHISYEVKQTELPGTPDEVLTPLVTEISTIDAGSIEDESLKQFFEGFNAYYASLSASDKQAMAEAYAANFNTDDSNLSQRMAPEDVLTSCEEHIRDMEASALVAINTVEHPPVSILFNAITLVKLNTAVTTCREILDIPATNLFLEFREPEDDNGRVVFVSGTERGFALNLGTRGLQASDEEGATGIVAESFEVIHRLNTLVTDKINPVIAANSEAVPEYFTAEPLPAPVSIPEEAETQVALLAEEQFMNVGFGVSGPDVSFTDLAYADGSIHIAMNILNPDWMEGDEIETSLTYTYAPGNSNRIEGTLPIVVQTYCKGAGPAADIEVSGDTATVVPTRGNAPLSYTWSTGDEGPVVSGLAPGEYTVVISDFNQRCSTTIYVTIE